MNLPKITVKELLEAGVHLGHKTFRWNMVALSVFIHLFVVA